MCPRSHSLKCQGWDSNPGSSGFLRMLPARIVISFLLTRRGGVQAKTHCLGEQKHLSNQECACAWSPPSETSHMTLQTLETDGSTENKYIQQGPLRACIQTKKLNPDANLIGQEGMRPKFGSHCLFLAV